MEVADKARQMLEEAVKIRASDIFFLPKKGGYKLRLRAGDLEERPDLTLEAGNELVNWFKYQAEMDIAEHRRPQVGSMVVNLAGQDYWLRLSSVGDYRGKDSLVIRIIYSLGESRYFFPDQFKDLVDLCWRRGMIVTSGPTGSGKTTTMYELARRLSQTKMVMTIEDPVEVYEESFFQAQVNAGAGISYASLLKAALRHRPDVLIIGEIRDEETAHLAVDAALSGHLVLATVHAKSTYQTISRLESLGVKNNELVNCLTAVSYQRLLPGEKGPACLLDLASREDLLAALGQSVRGNFAAWEENLSRLVEKGEISADVARQYKGG